MSTGKGKNVRKGTKGFVTTEPKKPVIPTAQEAYSTYIKTLTFTEKRELFGRKLMGFRERYMNRINGANMIYIREEKEAQSDFSNSLLDKAFSSTLPIGGVSTYFFEHSEFPSEFIDKLDDKELTLLSINKGKYDLRIQSAKTKRNASVRDAAREFNASWFASYKEYPKPWYRTKKRHLGDVCEICGKKQKYGSQLCGHWDIDNDYTDEEGNLIRLWHSYNEPRTEINLKESLERTARELNRPLVNDKPSQS